MVDPAGSSPIQRRTARLYWLFLGPLGAHWFYLGRGLRGGLQLALALLAVLAAGKTLLPLIALGCWWLADGVLIGRHFRPAAVREAAALDTQDTRQLDDWREQYRTAMQRLDYARAAELCEHALERLAGSAGRESVASARWQAWRAEAERLRGHADEAVALLNQAIGWQERLGDDEGLCESLRYLASARMDEGHAEAAEPVYRRLLEKLAQLGRNGPERAGTMIELAALYVANHRPQDALPLYQEAARIATAKADAVPLDRVRAAIGEGDALIALERLDDAAEAFHRALTQLEVLHDTVGFLMADCRRGLGIIHQRQGRLDEADVELTAAFEIREKLAPTRTATDTPFHVDAAAGQRTGRTAIADPAATALILQELVGVCIARHQPERAVALATHWADLQARLLGPDHPRVAKARARVASLRRSLGVSAAAVVAPSAAMAPAFAADGVIAMDAPVRPDNGLAHAEHDDNPHRDSHAIASIHTLDGALHLAERITGQPRRLYATRHGGLERYDSAHSVLVPAERARACLDRLRDLLPLNFQVFIGTTDWQAVERHDGWRELVILSAESPLECVRVADTAGEGVGNAQLLMRLRTWDMRYGVDILTADMHEIGFRLFRPPSDTAAYYRELLAFCPNLAATIPDERALAALLADPHALIRLRWLPVPAAAPQAPMNPTTARASASP